MTNPLRFEVPGQPDPVRTDRVTVARAAAHRYEQKFTESNRNALALGQLGLRALFILNGGALLIFPIYLVLLDVDLDAAFGSFVYSGSLFVAGILLAAVATASGYFAEIQRSRMALLKLRALAAEVHDGEIDIAEPVGGEPAIVPGRFKDGGHPRLGLGRLLRIAAIASAFASLFCFAGGAYFAAATVITGVSQDSDTDATKV
ncbi:MAG: hypothetical protein WAN51_04355 [Alphaproteobacteria bacterium]